MEKQWAELTWQEKREERFKRWLNPEVKFNSKAAEKLYKDRATRFIKAVKLEEPDRVPCMLPSGMYPAFYAGYTLKDIMYDYAKMKEAYLKFVADFDMDTYTGPALVFPGKVLDMTDHRLHKWPGHGLPDNASLYQYVEKDYMKADEYPLLLGNPADFWWRYLLPRVVGALEPFRKLPQMNGMMGIPIMFYGAMAEPDVEQAFKTMIEAGKEVRRWQQAVGEIGMATLAAGVPNLRGGGMGGAPFDSVADMLRGTQGMVMDMYRQPERLHEAMEIVIPNTIKSAVAAADASGCPFCFMPLHKGDESFMSPKQFETFYWPSYRRVLMGMVEEGLVPYPFAEGRYGARLDIIKDMPRGSVLWSFEDIDMARAKKVLGDTACIAGNVPSSVLYTKTPAEVKEYCRKLIETCAPGGGYILTGAAGMNEGNPENLRAVMAAAVEYGVY
ncbi:MAG: uroporphyrinogen decarboxylase family protein [Dehalococcoidales bacterium]|jgi:uroporphyrinogen-III decarboxylase